MEVGQTKTCSKCGETKGLDCFSKKKAVKSGVQAECKACVAAYNKGWHVANRERKSARNKEYRATNRERVAAYNKEWHVANRERKSAYDKEYRATNRRRRAAHERTRRQTDPQFRLAQLLRGRIYTAIRSKAKKGSAVRDLGMPIDAFLVYLNLDALDKYGIPYTGNEKLFHIDHIRPLASFDLEDAEQLRIAVRWSNLQVLLATENLAKGAKLLA